MRSVTASLSAVRVGLIAHRQALDSTYRLDCKMVVGNIGIVSFTGRSMARYRKVLSFTI
jgi:hypothetical protein